MAKRLLKVLSALIYDCKCLSPVAHVPFCLFYALADVLAVANSSVQSLDQALDRLWLLNVPKVRDYSSSLTTGKSSLYSQIFTLELPVASHLARCLGH